jgi:hypothetical protein
MSTTAPRAASIAAVPEARRRRLDRRPRQPLIICGPTGVGKSWLACALGHKACRDNRSVLYQRVPKLFGDLALARGDGRAARIKSLGGVQLLILDDWGLEPARRPGPPRSAGNPRRTLRPPLDHRHQPAPVADWHAVIGDPTYADAILDRLVHNAHRLDLSGDSLRRTRSKPADVARRLRLDLRATGCGSGRDRHRSSTRGRPGLSVDR